MAWNVDPALLSRTYRDPLAIFGLVVDLLPIFAVLTLGWGAAPLVFLYWLEIELIHRLLLLILWATCMYYLDLEMIKCMPWI